jgi:hypothetical protein
MWSIGGLENITPRTSAGINQRSVPQFLPGREIVSAPLTLDIRSKCPTQIRPFIPSQSKPAEIFDNGRSKFCRTSIAVEIFNPEDESSIVLLRAFLRAPESEGVAEMKITRRRRSNAAAIRNFGFQMADFSLA